MARSRYRIYDPEAPHFLTATVVHWIPLFSQPANADIILNALRYMQAHEHWQLYAYVLMEHHLHWIAEAPDLPRTGQRFKSFTARRLIDGMKQRGATWMLRQLELHKQAHKRDQQYQLWQEGNQPKQILGRAMLRQKIDDIHQNPVRRGYVEAPVHWRYSSARDYAGAPGLVPVTVVEL